MNPIALFWLVHPSLAWFYHLALVQGALAGLSTAVAVDIHTFLGWKDIHDASTWSWRVALLRWAQGLVYGATGGGVMGGLLG